MSASSTPPATLLLAEDLEDDVFIMKRALQAAGILNPLQVVMDGQAVLSYLAGEGPYSERDRYPLPSILFLDLMMPYKNGFDVLAWMQKNPEMQSIPVVVLTGSAQERDRNLAYQLGARTYLVKPPRPEHLLDIVSSLESFYNNNRGGSPFVLAQEPPRALKAN